MSKEAQVTEEQKQQEKTQTEWAAENSGGASNSADDASEAAASDEWGHQGKVQEAPREAAVEESAAPETAEPTAAAPEISDASPEEYMAMEALVQANQAFTIQLEELKSQYARLAADFDNFRKRTQKEKLELEAQAKCATIRELLTVVDNFERAKEQIKPQNDGEMNLHKSYLSVYKQMVESLKRIGVSAMYPKGEEFDPNFHEAVMREPTREYAEGIVTDEFRRGYMLGERVLRHAMVKVAAAPEDEDEAPASETPDSPQE
ncbi:nucleotide exchange factor GrpE [Laspinema sp. D1]|uniref:Protein GrpE n=1 Tax=Laspinema palackyanum D2a TaxID=2953684 RepID=A0ABT2MN00_9CYAN|nr:nucleotide exchange factor GrpE [Laspinema sp. D2b]MCT7966119.1 nucleotide exchange factor GrpE [Laspinema sp. D2a]